MSEGTSRTSSVVGSDVGAGDAPVLRSTHTTKKAINTKSELIVAILVLQQEPSRDSCGADTDGLGTRDINANDAVT